MSGTSMAAPHVTGLIALLMSASPTPMDTAKIRRTLIDTARANPPGGQGWDPRFGFGRVDAAAAVARQVDQPQPDTALPVPLIPAAAAGNGAPYPYPFDGFLTSVVRSAAAAPVRLRIEIQIEPLHGAG